MSSVKPLIRHHTLRPFRELRILNDNANDFDSYDQKTRENPKNFLNLDSRRYPSVKLLNSFQSSNSCIVPSISTSGIGGTSHNVPPPPGSSDKLKKYNEKFIVGSAEIFGAEMLIDNEYIIKPNARLAIYTWSGCTLQLKGNITQEYDSTNNAMKEYLNFSSVLDSKREVALLRNKIGPKILITGSASSGKSSICHILVNYALRRGWHPTFIELDPRGSNDKEKFFFLPGIIGAMLVDNIEDTEPNNSLNYFFGSYEINDNPNLFFQLCECISAVVHLQFLINLEETINIRRKNENVEGIDRFTAASGLIINAPFQATSAVLYQIIETFEIDAVVVIDNPSLQFNLEEKYCYKLPEKDDETISNCNSNKNINSSQCTVVLGLPKLDGVISTDNNRLRYLRRHNCHRYFFGSFEQPIRPVSLKIPFKNVNFVVFDTLAPISNQSSELNRLNSNKEKAIISLDWVGNPKSLLNCILGVPSATKRENITTSNLLCLAYVRNVEEKESELLPNDDSQKQNDYSNYHIELLLPLLPEGKNSLKFLIVPLDTRQLKWIPDSL